jgi:hypothetical protein
MALVASVAENSLTGIDTNPNETVNDAIDRAAIFGSSKSDGRFPF